MLPHHVIIPIRRADASGDTLIFFTQFLNFSTPSWEDKVGYYGTTITWPSVPGEMTAVGNRSMLQTAAATPYAVAYIGISFAGDVAKAGLGTAMLENQSGKFLPTPDTIGAAASELDRRTPPDERLRLVFAPGDNSYYSIFKRSVQNELYLPSMWLRPFI
jgi:phosphate transport system substrate-binding protein